MKKTLIVLALTLLAACSWHPFRRHPVPEPTQLIVTGAPAGSIVFIDDMPQGQPAELNDKPQLLDVAAGTHKVEVRRGDTVVYREDTFVKKGEKRVVTVLSGSNRE
jgi:hypothetical protein